MFYASKMEINAWAILFSFLINFLRRSSSKICSFLVDKLYKITETNEINQLKTEIKTFQNEKDSYNPIDEFAKYALVDRKLNKALDKLNSLKSTNRTFKMKKMFYFNIAYTIFIGIISIALIWTNYDRPIIDFSNLVESYSSRNLNGTAPVYDAENVAIIFYPLNNFLSFPSTDKKNSIGVTVWLFFVNRSIDMFINKYNARIKTD